ncbi:MAG: amidohydrolase family protein [Armatimonadota bacterium]|jgi:predicted TIM-barrel fold metal-dependent hydrolase
MRIIDAHIHLSNMLKPYTEQDLLDDLAEAGADGAVVFAQPSDIYREIDDQEHRMRANRYCLEAAAKREHWHAFYFAWNDYTITEDFDEYVGIKWHRHPDEPQYDYQSAACERFIEVIRGRNLPTIIEEEFGHTVALIERLDPAPVILPHCGRLNGGIEMMDRFFDDDRILFDTSVTPLPGIEHILDNVGPERLIFGSDVSGTSLPFHNFPAVELEKVLKLDLAEGEMQMVLSGNIERLIAAVD